MAQVGEPLKDGCSLKFAVTTLNHYLIGNFTIYIYKWGGGGGARAGEHSDHSPFPSYILLKKATLTEYYCLSLAGLWRQLTPHSLAISIGTPSNKWHKLQRDKSLNENYCNMTWNSKIAYQIMIQSCYSKFQTTSIFKWFSHLCHLFNSVPIPLVRKCIQGVP